MRYNSHYIPSLGASPEELRQSPDRSNALRDYSVSLGKPAVMKYDSFKIGDLVRIRLEPYQQSKLQHRSKVNRGIAKGVQRWSKAVYRIVGRNGYSFELQDTAGRPALRTYRQHELMKVPQGSIDVPDVFESLSREARVKRKLCQEGLLY